MEEKCELLLKRGKDKGIEMQSSISQQNHKGRERKCAFARTKGLGR